MMALFIVLWLLSSSQKVQQAVGGYFRDPIGRGIKPGTNMNGTGRDVSTLKDDMSQLKEKLKSALKLIPHFDQIKGNVEITITEEGLRIELIENSNGMFFESGKPMPTAFGKELLGALATQLSNIPNKILIEGHTDAVPYDPDAPYTNWELSTDRANTARRVMESSGLPKNQIAQIRGYADHELRDKTHPEDPSNRRVSLIVRYMDSAKSVDLTPIQGNVKTTEEHPVMNPAGIMPNPHASATSTAPVAPAHPSSAPRASTTTKR
jgi:chemotaxis protein MotB